MTIHRDADATETAWLAAQIAADQPTLPHALRSTIARVCKYAGLLEAELKHFRPLENYMAGAIKDVGTRTGQPVSDELYNGLCDRFGITEVRLALERVANAHPDAPELAD
jgi:hypothetical protein